MGDIVQEKQYLIGDFEVRYLIDKDKNVSMIIIPKDLSNKLKKTLGHTQFKI